MAVLVCFRVCKPRERERGERIIVVFNGVHGWWLIFILMTVFNERRKWGDNLFGGKIGI